MRKLITIALALGLMAGPAFGAPASERIAGAEARVGNITIVAGGGTPVTNGIFFPGTAINNGNGLEGMPPVPIDQGADFDFVNLDEASVGNGHQILSIKRKKGRPLFQSDFLKSPGETDLVITSHLKPGVYAFFCTVHAGMFGRIEIVGG